MNYEDIPWKNLRSLSYPELGTVYLAACSYEKAAKRAQKSGESRPMPADYGALKLEQIELATDRASRSARRTFVTTLAATPVATTWSVAAWNDRGVITESPTLAKTIAVALGGLAVQLAVVCNNKWHSTRSLQASHGQNEVETARLDRSLTVREVESGALSLTSLAAQKKAVETEMDVRNRPFLNELDSHPLASFFAAVGVPHGVRPDYLQCANAAVLSEAQIETGRGGGDLGLA